MLDKKIVKEQGKDENDTGATAVQISHFTIRINKINEHLKDMDRCMSCKSAGKISNIYKCQMRDVSGQSTQSRSIPINFNEQPDVCNHYNTIENIDESTGNYLINHFLILFLSCLCLTFLSINNKIKETLINVSSCVILYLLIIMSKNYLNENISMAIIVLGLLVSILIKLVELRFLLLVGNMI